jgi:hypothetical protein
MKKIYHSKSNKVSLEQLDIDRQWIFDNFKDIEYLQHIRDSKYDPGKIQQADMVIVSTPNYDDKIGKGVTGEILAVLNRKPILQLKVDSGGMHRLVFIRGIQVLDETKWDERHAIIHLGEVMDYLVNS